MPELWTVIEQRAAALGHTERLTAVQLGIPVRSRGTGDRRLMLTAVVVLLVAALVGTVAVGSGLVRMPPVAPAALPQGSATPSAAPSTARPSSTPAASPVAVGPAPWVVFARSRGSAASSGGSLVSRLPSTWAMRADGTGAHELQADRALDVAWSPDGTRLVANSGHILVAEVGETIGDFVDTGVVVPEPEQWTAFDVAPDGEHVVFVRTVHCSARSTVGVIGGVEVVLAAAIAETAGTYCHTLGTLDLRTGQQHDLGKTLVKDQTRDRQLALELPAWSPDGRRIAYTVLDEATDARELWIVNADGTDPAKVALDADVSVLGPRWSPDGTRIAFAQQRWVTDTSPETTVYVADLASGQVERIQTGSDATDRRLCCVDWLDDTHLRVGGGSGDDARFWSVALDVTPHDAQPLADLTEALAAIDAPGRVTTVSEPGDPGRTFYWQPAGR